MILNDELLKKAVIRVNELQNETIQKADKIDGSKQYVAKQMKLFQEAEEHRQMLNTIISEQQQVSSQFIK